MCKASVKNKKNVLTGKKLVANIYSYHRVGSSVRCVGLVAIMIAITASIDCRSGFLICKNNLFRASVVLRRRVTVNYLSAISLEASFANFIMLSLFYNTYLTRLADCKMVILVRCYCCIYYVRYVGAYLIID